jgi:ACS family hexuronate transporter-like MFS transporter
MSMVGASLAKDPGRNRSTTWRWYICVLLLLATVVNYMDRLTTNTLALQIQGEFQLNDEQYGQLELGFGLAFATGSLFFGWLVDRVGVYWLYPIVLVGWSAMGFLTGLSQSFGQLMLLRIMLGLFEAGHFPCGLKTIQLLLAPRDRALGSSMLQSGTALGAILAPQVIKALLRYGDSSWRTPFLVIGAGGCVWVFFWLASIRPSDLREPSHAVDVDHVDHEEGGGWADFFKIVGSARFFCLAVMVVCINLNWHLFRVWLPKFLQQARGYSFFDMLDFQTLYYIAADIGALTAGALSGLLARRGLSVFAARMWVFAGCCALTTLTTAAAILPAGPWLKVALLLVAFGGLGSYAAYYSLTQDLSRKHMGKVSGLLSTTTWLTTAAFHPIFGRYLDRTRSYDLVIGISGWLPTVALVVVLLLWNRGAGRKKPLAIDALE